MWVGMVGEHMTFWSIFGRSGLTFVCSGNLVPRFGIEILMNVTNPFFSH